MKNCGKQNYELIEYINDVNREYTEVLVEQNIFGKTDTSYVYGAPQYENEYTYNGESYNPNIESQYLRARYYDVVTANFLTEDTYLGNIIEPLTLNRYNYCSSSPLNYVDPSGNTASSILLPMVGKNAVNELFGFGMDISKEDFDKIVLSLKLLNAMYTKEIFDNVNSFIEGMSYSTYDFASSATGILDFSSNSTGILEAPSGMPLNEALSVTPLESNARIAEENTAFYAGRCLMDGLYALTGIMTVLDGIGKIGGSGVLTYASGGTLAPGAAVVAGVGVAEVTVGGAIVLEGAGNLFDSLISAFQSSDSGGKTDKETYTYENGTYDKAEYHSNKTTGRKNAAPKDGQFALDNSVSIGENTRRRVGLDSNGNFVVFDETSEGIFHGHVRKWNSSDGMQGLTQEMKNALYEAGYIKSPKGTNYKLTDFAKEMIGIE